MSGELAALLTAFVWSFGSLFFTSASRQIGAVNVNRIRLIFGAILLGAMLLLSRGWLMQPEVGTENIFYLALSGVIGLAIGDTFLFSAMVMIGTRLTMLIYALSPAIATIFAWFYLGEKLDLISLLGIAITLGGVLWVTAEPQRVGNGPVRKMSANGLIFAFLGGAGQAVGYVFAKKGLGIEVDPLAGTFVRMIAAVAVIWGASLIGGSYLKTIRSLGDARGMLLSAGGAFCGPFLGVWMSLVAVKNTSAGVASAITSIVPVLVIPWVIIFYKEKVSLRAIFGALLAVIGIFILFMH